MPIVVVNGQLVNYIFVNVRVNLTSRADVTKLREAKEPFFRDALVRDAHRARRSWSRATSRRSTRPGSAPA